MRKTHVCKTHGLIFHAVRITFTSLTSLLIVVLGCFQSLFGVNNGKFVWDLVPSWSDHSKLVALHTNVHPFPSFRCISQQRPISLPVSILIAFSAPMMMKACLACFVCPLSWLCRRSLLSETIHLSRTSPMAMSATDQRRRTYWIKPQKPR